MPPNLVQNTIQGKSGRWVQCGDINFFVDNKNNIILPSELRGQNINDLDASGYEVNSENNADKLQLLSALMVANTTNYRRLQEYLENLVNIVSLGTEFKAEQEQFEKFNTFINTYVPIEPKMRAFLQGYQSSNQGIIDSLGQLISNGGQNLESDDSTSIPKLKKDNPINVRKFGLYRFPFLKQEKLYIGEIEEYQILPQVWNYTGTHFKAWVNVKGIPFLVNGYNDDEYSVVNRILASQIGKLLGLNCEEVLFGYYHDKAVTLTAFTECVSLLENQTFELYELDTLNYIYQSEQKRCFYFLIQHWAAYAKTDRGIKERFTEHFVAPEGSIFMSNHQNATFLTPQQLPKNLMIPLEIDKMNYRAIKDMVNRIGTRDLAEMVFDSIPPELVELHDDHAKKMNKPTFLQKKQSFDANWNNLLESVDEFENLGVK